MSYNISTWHIRRIHLELPLDFDFLGWLQAQPARDARGDEKCGRQWCLDGKRGVQCELAAGTWKLDAAGKELSGVIQGQKLVLSDPHAVEWTSDGSGYLYEDVLLPLFQAFKGDLEAMVIWEHGDTVKNLTITQGVVHDEEIS